MSFIKLTEDEFEAQFKPVENIEQNQPGSAEISGSQTAYAVHQHGDQRGIGNRRF